ncbi:helix-turn-helix domain-containing protein [Marinitenerispora sediminis]|uniref:Transcriptional regulator n=1 Tax=Marinitenerispora sediminis TaxID=1931232 RepID=A0A368T5K8_9ACTN|nr:helix-turn-helix transcriptional regulator [Marinitenerispora sediminis]RCV51866.1 transcriptional regulator [Marinitenerispora sediminis]RCV54811.1 transcriptional regulator [Marinitenerispora sediminis]RCV58957.1 transcriptional regulator [Marinitenerispora sediminis]
MTTGELARALRSWRDRVRPSDVGLPDVGLRRTAGLRREELAAIAGISVDYLVRLEQGRARNPSTQVLAALGRALRLSAGERDLLYRAAGAQPPAAGVVPRHIGPGTARILDRLADTPVAVFTASWDLLHANALWTALLGGVEPASSRSRNLVWRHFSGAPSPVVHTEEEHDRFGRELVSDLRRAVTTYPDDRELASLVAELRATSVAFAERWDDFAVIPGTAARKTIHSPAAGLVTLDCDVLATLDGDLRIIVYTARPHSEDAGKLDLLRVTGPHEAG